MKSGDVRLRYFDDKLSTIYILLEQDVYNLHWNVAKLYCCRDHNWELDWIWTKWLQQRTSEA